MYQEKTMRKDALIASAIKIEDWPSSAMSEITFAGRSNSGKSSLINALIGGKHARTSSRPGKTSLINFYDYKGKMIFTDLPGYGYAKVSIKTKKSWKGIVEEYLLNRENLEYVFILCDVRRGIEQEEKDLVRWLKTVGIHFYFIFTKIDKLTPHELSNQKKHIAKIATGVFYVSVLKKSGIEELRIKLEELGGI
jgi:GTP-binding protein